MIKIFGVCRWSVSQTLTLIIDLFSRISPNVSPTPIVTMVEWMIRKKNFVGFLDDNDFLVYEFVFQNMFK
jgi:hypothetical protein